MKILPLNYGDGFSHELISLSRLPAAKALRNGTVSGTALLFAIQYSSKNIFMCGLDMAAQKGFQHTQPNELEANSAQKDFRLSTKEGRLARAGLSGASLDIYRNWFQAVILTLKLAGGFSA